MVNIKRDAGAKNFFFQIWEFACRALLGGLGACSPRNFFKTVRFRVCFDQILSLFFSENFQVLY